MIYKKGGSIKESIRNAIWQVLQKFQEKERNTRVLAINKFEEKVRYFRELLHRSTLLTVARNHLFWFLWKPKSENFPRKVFLNKTVLIISIFEFFILFPKETKTSCENLVIKKIATNLSIIYLPLQNEKRRKDPKKERTKVLSNKSNTKESPRAPVKPK